MSLKPGLIGDVPERTARVALAAFPKGRATLSWCSFEAHSRTHTTPFTLAQRASVGSTEAAKDVVARVGVIDRST